MMIQILIHNIQNTLRIRIMLLKIIINNIKNTIAISKMMTQILIHYIKKYPKNKDNAIKNNNQ